MNDKLFFTKWLQDELNTRGWSQSDLARATGLTRSTVNGVLNGTHGAKRDTAIIYLLLDTGLRASEVSRLLVEDVNMETGAVHVRPYGSGAKSKDRTVYLGQSARKTLWLYLAERDQLHKNDVIFLTNEDKPLDRHALYKMLSRLGERANVADVHPHRFRHTFAIQYLRNGGDIFTLQRLLGHSSLEMVKHYLAIADTDSQTAHKRASPVDRWRL